MPLNFQAVQFLTSATTLSGCPPDSGKEVVFCGRSNAGKSSVINTLTGNRNLARTSKTPGRTQMINFFSVSSTQRLVDLPGYGYAKVSASITANWQKNLDEFLESRKCLRGAVLLMDIRHPLKDSDRIMINWLKSINLPIHILLTKSDKLSKNNKLRALSDTIKELGQKISCQTFSSTQKDGLDSLEKSIKEWLE
ncbi:MAG: YihA family ribosome biogenesis GTP-binding protein [Gammaproteobacteria bacterium]|mgnify:CR=1 FL=1|nr:YihA family ribosome biogenesis GTP-binding protein [Gammaproteobacteria bacterium]